MWHSMIAPMPASRTSSVARTSLSRVVTGWPRLFAIVSRHSSIGTISVMWTSITAGLPPTITSGLPPVGSRISTRRISVSS
jgi:hypothetical protein